MDSTRQQPFNPAPADPVPLERALEPRAVWVVDLRSHRVIRQVEADRSLPASNTR